MRAGNCTLKRHLMEWHVRSGPRGVGAQKWNGFGFKRNLLCRWPSLTDRRSPDRRKKRAVRATYSMPRKNWGRNTCFGVLGAVCSFSSASRSHIRAMSVKINLTRGLFSRSDI